MGRKPDYNLKVLDKTNNRRGFIGSGWANEDGSITIQIDPCCVLGYNPNLNVVLFPNDRNSSKHDDSDEPAPF